MKWVLVMVTPGSLHPLIDVEQVNFEWGVHIGGSFVQTCAGVRRFPPWVAHKGPSLRCPRAPPQVPLSAPRCSPAPPLTPDLSHHTATYWVALAGNHKTPPPTAPALSPIQKIHWGSVQGKCLSWASFYHFDWNVFTLEVRFYIGSITSTSLTQSERKLYQKKKIGKSFTLDWVCNFPKGILPCTKFWRGFSDSWTTLGDRCNPHCNFLEDVQVLARLGHHLLVGLQAHFQQRRPAVGHSKDAILLHHHYHCNHHHHHNGYHMT